ncbi:MAG: ABC transporter ATP-binding protein [Pseudolabrys sp.]|nr:ABC transporter ATP-binding protein [Pseudolabrys sp.]
MAIVNGTGWSGELRRFLRDFVAYAGRKGVLAAALVAAAATLEGLSLVLIVPLLGIVIGSQTGGRLENTATALLARLGIERPFAQLALLLTMFSLLMILRALVIAARDVRVATLQAGFVEQRRARIVDLLAAARWDRLVQLRHARVTHIMSGDIARIGAMAYQALQCLMAAVLLLAQGMLIFLLAPALAAFAVGLLAIVMFILVPGLRRTRGLGEATTNANLTLLNVTTHFLGGLKTAMSQNLQAAFATEIRHALHEQSRSQVDAMRHQTRRRLALTTTASLVAAGVVLAGFGLLDVSPPVLITLLLIMARMVGPLGQTQQGVQQIAFALPVYAKVTGLERDLAALPGEGPSVQAGDGSIPGGPVVFHNVSFQHPNEDNGDSAARGISHLSLAIHPGELIGITGPSGAGKTTFADLLVGLFPPQHGEITVGGTALQGAARTAWQDQVGYVSQDPFLFHDTIRRNLVWANPQAGEADLWRALALAGADDLVRRMAQGMDTIVGERGALMSGGERQRLALARAVLRGPRLLLLDEATNALDVAGERDVIERLRAISPRPAIVIIAHRPESVALCDRVLYFANGRCIDDNVAQPRIVAQQ